MSSDGTTPRRADNLQRQSVDDVSVPTRTPNTESRLKKTRGERESTSYRQKLKTIFRVRIHFWHALLGVHSAKCRHQSPEWTILSHANCFTQGEIIGFQVIHVV